MSKLNFVFFGTPDVASETLKILKQEGFLPSLIITSPDKPKGRKLLLTPPPAKVWAEKNNIPVLQPELLDESTLKTLRTFNFELSIVVAYGKIIPENILNLPELGSINVHYSLLPKYRGASPVESVILADEKETGVTIQKMVYKMDAGPILAQEKVAILPDEKAPDLRRRLTKLGAEMLVKLLTSSAFGTSPQGGGWEGVPQDESQATYTKKITKEDGLINLEAELPSELYNKFRAYASWPRIFFFQSGKRIIITKARLENNKFIIEKIVPESGKETDWKS